MKNRFGSLIGTLTAFLLVGMMAQPRACAQDGHIPLVTHSTFGTVLDDNFESPPSTSPPNNGLFPGFWTLNTGGGSTVQNWDASLSPNLAAFQGNQYVRLTRPVGGGNSLLGGTFGTGEVPTSFSTGKLQIQFALRMFTYTDFQAGVELDAGSFNPPDIRFGLVTRVNGRVDHLVPTGGPWIPTGITGISTNDWQRWLIDVDLDNNRYNLTVDNQTAFNLPFFALGQSSRLLLGASNSGTQFFVDALPEPTVVALVGVGGLLLLRRRRKME